jgi:ketosteroid isomerase-like protein
MRVSYLLLLLIIPAFACRPANTSAADTSASAKLAIDAANAEWARLTSTGHADSIAEFYTADAVLMPPNMATEKGKEAIRAFFATINTMQPHPILALRSERVVAFGSVAVEVGRWHWSYPPGVRLPPGTVPVDSGKYMARWEQQNGTWLMADDIWNSDTPPPSAPPPPAPARRRQ